MEFDGGKTTDAVIPDIHLTLMEERIVTAAVGIVIPFRNNCQPPRKLDQKGKCKTPWRHQN